MSNHYRITDNYTFTKTIEYNFLWNMNIYVLCWTKEHLENQIQHYFDYAFKDGQNKFLTQKYFNICVALETILWRDF